MGSAGIDVMLPVGIEVDGQRFKRVIVDEMCGYDEENLASPEVKGNASKANTILLRRIIQEIPGYLSRKSNRYGLVDEDLVRNMFQVDRDAAIIGMLKYSDDPTTVEKLTCPDCGVTQPPLTVDLRNLTFRELGSEDSAGFSFVLPRGIPEGASLYKDGFFRFPRGADIEEIAAVAAQNVADAQTRLMFRCMKINDDGFVLDREALKRMPKSDRDYVTWLLAKNLPGYQTRLSLTCFNCGSEVKGHVDIAAFFDSTRKLSD